MLSIVQDILDATAALADKENMKVTLENSAKGCVTQTRTRFLPNDFWNFNGEFVHFRALIAGMATLLGGILGGKKGLVVGGAVGGIGAATMLSGELLRSELFVLRFQC
jgi:hypothetical protein